MPMHIPLSIDTELSSIDTPLFKTGPITSTPSPATQRDILEILQREQDHAMSLLSLSPLLSSLFISYANRATALELASTTPSPESIEWKVLQTTITALREENEKLKSESRETAKKLEAAEAYQEAFRSQVSSLKEINAAQQEEIKSLWAELFEAGDKYDRLVEDSSMEKSALQVQVLDLEAQRRELKETVIEQQIKTSKLERRMTDDAPTYPTYQPPSPPTFPVRQRVFSSPAPSFPSSPIPSSPILHVRPPLPERGEAAPGPSLAPTLSFNSHGLSEPSYALLLSDSRGMSKRPGPVIRGSAKQQSGWFAGIVEGT